MARRARRGRRPLATFGIAAMHDVLLAVLAGWVLYNGWRVLRCRRHAIEVGAEAESAVPVSAAFAAYLKVREFYLQLSPAHRKYEPRGDGALKDAVIEVWETAGFQSVKHRYRVTELVPEQRMALVSEASQVQVLGLFRGTTRSEVEFRFAPVHATRTRLGLGIAIVFPNALRHFLARLVFTEAIWRRHARQEMAALARVIEQRAALAAA